MRRLIAMTIAVLGVLIVRGEVRGQQAPKPATTRATADDAARTERAWAKLAQPIPEVNFHENELKDVIDFLVDVTGVNIHVNWRALATVKVVATTKVTLRLRDASLVQIFDLVVQDAAGGRGKIAWAVIGGTVEITSAADLKQNVVTRTYDVRTVFQHARGVDRAGCAAALMKMITGSVDPSSWRENGGTVGMVKEQDGVLIVAQTEENQAAVANLVRQLTAIVGEYEDPRDPIIK